MNKSIISIFAFWLLIGTCAIASDTKVPMNILEVFQNKFPGTNPYRWEINDKVAYAFFTREGRDKVCRITKDGKISFLGNSILEIDVPDEVINTYMENFPILDIANFYSVTLHTKEKALLIVADDLSYKLCLLYSLDGKLIRNEIFDIPENDYLLDESDEEKDDDEEW